MLVALSVHEEFAWTAHGFESHCSIFHFTWCFENLISHSKTTFVVNRNNFIFVMRQIMVMLRLESIALTQFYFGWLFEAVLYFSCPKIKSAGNWIILFLINMNSESISLHWWVYLDVSLHFRIVSRLLPSVEVLSVLVLDPSATLIGRIL